jgi:AhpD family alkylhydroperoxidase
MNRFARSIVLATAVVACGAVFPLVVAADDMNAKSTETMKDIEATFGFVPSFVHSFPQAGLPGAWAELKAIEISEETALSPKEKALIGIAVAAQIPCQYCVWLDTKSAYLAGATDEEIQEAVAMSALVRHWSTIFHGNQVDFETFKAEFANMAKAADDAHMKTAGK